MVALSSSAFFDGGPALLIPGLDRGFISAFVARSMGCCLLQPAGASAVAPRDRDAHEVRNEVVEEVISFLLNISCTE